MTDIKWIKLSVGMFDDEKIKLIRTMPEGDNIIVIWIQLLCLAGKTNDSGGIYMGQNIYYTDEMLATLCDQPVNTMRIALQTLSQFEMIESNDNGLIEIVNWEKHQSTDKMQRIKHKNRERQQKYYYRNKLRELGVNVDAESFPDALDDLKELTDLAEEKPNVRLTLPNGTEVRSKKLEERSKKLEERSKKLEDRRENKDTMSSNLDDASDGSDLAKKRKSIMSSDLDSIPYKDIIDHLNNKANRSYRHTTNKNQSLIKARWNEGFSVKDFQTVIDNKVNEWEETDMSKYLRPETLFGAKFEGYLNQDPINEPSLTDERYNDLPI